MIGANDFNQISEFVDIVKCTGDLCNKDTGFTYTDQASLGESNGLYCESCFRGNSSEECSSRDRVACRGNQLQCVSYVGTAERGDLTIGHYSFKGCISDVGCIVKFSALPGTYQLVEKVFSCTDAVPEPVDCCGCE
ncbi:phospholipase A2 inhibitor NAI-like [Pelobates fuscus]|uniref:phospholipase A2 inhibitor NAI-like n=1 Tax=Pelobates fuscus TaxID=191477 RepID=UPI002FE46E62